MDRDAPPGLSRQATNGGVLPMAEQVRLLYFHRLGHYRGLGSGRKGSETATGRLHESPAARRLTARRGCAARACLRGPIGRPK